MDRISLSFEDYLGFITEEDVSDQMAVKDQKIAQMRVLLMNAAYMINKLRRKQAIIEVKHKLEKAIEERDEDCKMMRE